MRSRAQKFLRFLRGHRLQDRLGTTVEYESEVGIVDRREAEVLFDNEKHSCLYSLCKDSKNFARSRPKIG